MIDDKKILAIIPARGGSKRLLRKNVLNFNGEPLIAWSIKAGLRSKYIDKVVVTSDDAEILRIAKHLGVLTINRPAELSSDIATTFDAIKHALENLEKHDYVVLLQPTSPLRNEKHIDEAIELLKSNYEMNHPDKKDKNGFVQISKENKITSLNNLEVGDLVSLQSPKYIATCTINNLRKQ